MGETAQRLLLTGAFVTLFAVGVWAMARSWRRRGARDAYLLPLPQPTTDPADSATGLTGLYVGTVHAGRWTDRVVAGGLSRRAPAVLRLTGEGAVLLREGEAPLLVPRGAVTDAYTSPGLAGSVVGRRGVLVLGWRHRGVDLESGFRADDPQAQARVARELGQWAQQLGGVA